MRSEGARSRSRLVALVAGGVLAGWGAAVLVAAGQLPAAREVNPEVEAFVREAIADRFAAGRIPDMGMIEDRRHVFVLKQMPGDRFAVTPDALPKLPNTTLEPITVQDAEAMAKRTGRDVVYLVVGDPRVDGDTASLVLGVDLALPPDAGLVKMCCCTGRASFRRISNRWVFEKWVSQTCS